MLAAAVIVLAILLKTVLRLVEIPGTTAIAASVTSAAIKAYSIMSWPRVSLQIYLASTLLLAACRITKIKTVYLGLMLKNASGENLGEYVSKFSQVLEFAWVGY